MFFSKKNHLFLALGTILLVLISYAYFHYKGGLPYGDCLSYATIARSVVEGKGIYQNSFSPLGLAFLGHYPTMDFFQSLGFPLTESIFFKIFGVSDLTVVITSVFFLTLMLILTYFLALRFLKDTKLSYLLLCMLLINIFFIPYSITGLTEPFFTSIFLITILSFLRFEHKSWGYLVFGLFLGICYISRTSILFYLPAIFYLILSGGFSKSYYRLGLLLLGFAAIQMPFFIRAALFPNENNNFMTLPQEVLWGLEPKWFLHTLRSLDTAPLKLDSFSYFMNHMDAQLMRGVSNFFKIIYHLFVKQIGLNLIFLSFALTFFIKFKDNKIKRFVLFTQLLFIGSLLGFSIAWPIPRYFFPIVPFVAVSGIIALKEGIFPLCRYRKIMIAALPLLICIPSILLICKGLVATKDMPYKWAYMKNFIDKSIPENGSIVTNIPDVVSWYAGGNRKILFYPNDVKDLQEIEEKYMPLDAILLTDDMSYVFPSEGEWKELLLNPKKSVLDRFDLQDIYQDETSKAVVYVKRN